MRFHPKIHFKKSSLFGTNRRLRLAAGLLSVMLISTSSLAQGSGEIKSRLGPLEREVIRLESEVLPKLGGEDSFEDRLNYGRIFLANGDYEQAALFLYGAVTPPTGVVEAQHRKRPGYTEALYSLATSLFFLRNFEGSRRLFQTVLSLGYTPSDAEVNYSEESIKRLIDIGSRLKDFESVDKYYDLFLKGSQGRVPQEVRYLRGRSLFLAARDNRALEELEAIRLDSRYGIRAQYLVGAIHTRADDLPAALKAFVKLSKAPPKTVGHESGTDEKVIELSYLAQGRVLFEMERLVESIAAYQNIDYDSEYLAEMLYEITWAYVRRGQIAYRETQGTENEKIKAADASFLLAIEQLIDLKAVEPEGERAADITILMGNLRLQRNQFDAARAEFAEVLDIFQPVDDELRDLMKDPSLRGRILQDILALEAGGPSYETKLPRLVAKKAVEKEEVTAAIRVFKDVEVSRAEITATERMVVRLEEALAVKNKDLLFGPVAGVLSRSKDVSTELLSVNGEIAKAQHAMLQNVAPEAKKRLAALKERRETLERKISSMGSSGEVREERSIFVSAEIQQLEQLLHEAELMLHVQNQTLGGLDQLLQKSKDSPAAQPKALENTRAKLSEMRGIIVETKRNRDVINDELEAFRTKVRLSGGRGESEGDIRDAYQLALDREQIYLTELLGTKGRALADVRDQVRRLQDRNTKFYKRVDGKVQRQILILRTVIDEEREHLVAYRARVEQVNAEADAYRGRAAEVALQHVREDLNKIVVKADVGMVDVAFRQKQLQTERIGKLQRQKAIQLTDLNQAYADLNQDEAQ
ncbi:MAG: hypothetical protein GY822_23975 [Deltaproteobacteria bacterium]|nr:hypothetical protein [Deltaproteobacteria bacterium]